ncbi:GNAT family N-acetyltransferase [Psychrosphaera aquimarina]|uniref:GNAT family N-acetyltransferase n=1 Tax=Psychrosphaera aquimarina TaxID=2044854 RepID=A0ABU3QWY9_9GAMM|nr:GNAT family N-acetyltransferase [Psychrosphaera aquimarina]MDU0111951.1 GNAT family N-acetyltransferase [Psychrosphaera aquimarina]
MLLLGERITVRDMQESDADFMLALLNSPGFIDNIGDRNIRTKQQVIDKIHQVYTLEYPVYGLFTVVNNQTNEPLGTVSYLKRDHLSHDDIGFAFLPQHFGQGYAFETSKLLLDHVINQGKTCVVAVVNPTNVASIKLLEKLGFIYAGKTTMPGETSLISKYSFNISD